MMYPALIAQVLSDMPHGGSCSVEFQAELILLFTEYSLQAPLLLLLGTDGGLQKLGPHTLIHEYINLSI